MFIIALIAAFNPARRVTAVALRRLVWERRNISRRDGNSSRRPNPKTSA